MRSKYVGGPERPLIYFKWVFFWSSGKQTDLIMSKRSPPGSVAIAKIVSAGALGAVIVYQSVRHSVKMFGHKHHDEVQEFKVYEINERDKGSPVFLPFGGRKDATTGAHTNGLGDLVPFSNKVSS